MESYVITATPERYELSLATPDVVTIASDSGLVVDVDKWIVLLSYHFFSLVYEVGVVPTDITNAMFGENIEK